MTTMMRSEKLRFRREQGSSQARRIWLSITLRQNRRCKAILVAKTRLDLDYIRRGCRSQFDVSGGIASPLNTREENP